MRTQSDFSLGRGGIPWWAASAAFAAGELSALTIAGLPGTAFRDGWMSFQVLIGSTAARFWVVATVLPLVYSAASPSIYSVLGERVGPRTRSLAVGLFLFMRLLSGSARFMAGGIVVSALLGVPLSVALMILAFAAGALLVWGGARAVVWLGVAQTFAVLLAAGGAIVFLARHVEGGLWGILELARQHGRLSLFRFAPAGGRFFADPGLFWAAALSGFCGGAASFGADQELVQRLRCADDLPSARRALLASVGWGALIVLLYLLLGSGLFAYYHLHPGISFPNRVEHIYPQFAATTLPAALKWLVLLSAALVSLDLPLVGVSTVVISEVYRPLRPRRPEIHYLRAARVFAAALACWIAATAWLLARAGGWLWLALKIPAVTLGPLLAAFYVAWKGEQSSDRSTAIAMTSMVVVCVVLLALAERGAIALSSTWLFVYGALGAAWLSWGLAPSFPD